VVIKKSQLGSDYTTGSQANRPVAPAEGTQYFNTTTGGLQVYLNGEWVTYQKPADVSAPTSVVATNQGTGRAFNNGQASVSFTKSELGGLATNYTVTSSPGGYTNSGTSSPIVVTGLQSSTQYTYIVQASNSYSSANSIASAGVTATTIPQAPTIGTAAAGNGTASVVFTAGATGGESVTYTATSSPGNITASGASSPITVTGLTNGTAYTFTVTATNANGTSAASAASNSVTPEAGFSVQYLVVAGGGGGGGGYNGGGGGGGMRYSTTTVNAVDQYTVTVGAGGTKNQGQTLNKGGNSQFSTITSTGGGGGGDAWGAPGGSGGSGGGGTGAYAGVNNRGTGGPGNEGNYSPSEGNNGGTGVSDGSYGSSRSGGGGGGKGAVGGNGSGGTGGTGGAGEANSITGSSVTYSKGANGGNYSGCGQAADGYGGGGGSGGEGCGSGGQVGNAGVVILRYPNTKTITIGAGLTGSTSTVGADRVTTITAGTGTVSWI
jgi:hypothetical protein